MHDGEIESLSLAKELGHQVLTDELRACTRADAEGVLWVSTIDVLRTAKALGHLLAIKPSIDALRANEFYMDDELYDQVLAVANETVA